MFFVVFESYVPTMMLLDSSGRSDYHKMIEEKREETTRNAKSETSTESHSYLREQRKRNLNRMMSLMVGGWWQSVATPSSPLATTRNSYRKDGPNNIIKHNIVLRSVIFNSIHPHWPSQGAPKTPPARQRRRHRQTTPRGDCQSHRRRSPPPKK